LNQIKPIPIQATKESIAQQLCSTTVTQKILTTRQAFTVSKPIEITAQVSRRK